jgi:hypothetical protein
MSAQAMSLELWSCSMFYFSFYSVAAAAAAVFKFCIL